MDRQINILHFSIITYKTSPLPIRIDQPRLYRCEATWRWKPATFRDFDIWIVLAGRGTLFCNDTTHVLRPGCGFVFQPGDRIEAEQDPENSLVVFACHFIHGKSHRKIDRFMSTFFNFSVGDLDFVGRCAEQATHVYEQGQAGRQLAAALIGQLVAQALLLFERKTVVHPADQKLAALALEIRSQPGGEWDAPSMARRCALSTPQFNRRFKKTFGSSLRQYVLRERIGRAATLLRETELSIKAIAEALGYRDVFYFHRQFRQLHKQTPREVRLTSRSVDTQRYHRDSLSY